MALKQAWGCVSAVGVVVVDREGRAPAWSSGGSSAEELGSSTLLPTYLLTYFFFASNAPPVRSQGPFRPATDLRECADGFATADGCSADSRIHPGLPIAQDSQECATDVRRIRGCSANVRIRKDARHVTCQLCHSTRSARLIRHHATGYVAREPGGRRTRSTYANSKVTSKAVRKPYDGARTRTREREDEVRYMFTSDLGLGLMESVLTGLYVYGVLHTGVNTE